MSNVFTNHVVDVLIQNRERFLTFLISRVGDEATAEDILQSAYVRGLERTPASRPENPLQRAVQGMWSMRRPRMHRLFVSVAAIRSSFQQCC